MAKWPEIIEDIFITGTDLNSQSIIGVNLFIRGKRWTITVDDYLLFNTKKEVPKLLYAKASY